MNVLGFVAALLLMLSLFLTALRQDLFSFSKLQSSHINHSEAARSAQNEFEIAYYKSFRNPPKKDENKDIEVVSNVKTTSPKEKPKEEKWENMPECARLNLYPLLQKGAQDLPRLELFRKLLKTLYGNNLLQQQKRTITAHSLPDQILLAAKDASPFLTQTHLKDPSFQSLFYHMLKGSSSHAEDSYPSLLEYVKINAEVPNEKICLACADESLLRALFNEKVAKRLTQKRAHPLERLTITKGELEQILMEETRLLPHDDFWELIRFSHLKKKKTAITVSGKGQQVTFKKKGLLESSAILSK